MHEAAAMSTACSAITGRSRIWNGNCGRVPNTAVGDRTRVGPLGPTLIAVKDRAALTKPAGSESTNPRVESASSVSVRGLVASEAYPFVFQLRCNVQVVIPRDGATTPVRVPAAIS